MLVCWQSVHCAWAHSNCIEPAGISSWAGELWMQDGQPEHVIHRSAAVMAGTNGQV